MLKNSQTTNFPKLVQKKRALEKLVKLFLLLFPRGPKILFGDIPKCSLSFHGKISAFKSCRVNLCSSWSQCNKQISAKHT